MGMAASQARLIELTARKSNVEYAGQQINQQRTNLANESAGLFTDMMNLKVPTAPSTSDYTSTVYTFNDGANDCTITQIANNTESAKYNSTVTYYYNESKYTGLYKERSDLEITAKVDETETPAKTYYYYGTTKLSDYSEDKDKTALDQILNDVPNAAVSKNYKAGDTGQIKKYTSGTQTYYISLDNYSTSSGKEVTTQPVENCYASNVTSKVYNTCDAYIQKEDSGRYSSITLEDYSTSFDLTATTETDQNAYNDAMNEYNYQQQLYEKRVNEINAKTAQIQQEDRTLEMQLQQLDTEQSALQTEMDAVRKVIDKNVESTFKTFS